MKQTSRREFLKLAGKGMLGAAALSTVPAMLPARLFRMKMRAAWFPL